MQNFSDVTQKNAEHIDRHALVRTSAIRKDFAVSLYEDVYYYITGGLTVEGISMNHVTLFNFENDSFRDMNQMKEARCMHTSLIVKNLLYVFGGYDA